MRKDQDLTQLIADVESLSPVHQLLVGKESVWPVLRTYLSIRLRDDDPQPMSSSRQPKWFRLWMAQKELTEFLPEEDKFSSIQKANYLTLGYAWQRSEEWRSEKFNPTLDSIQDKYPDQSALHLEIAFSRDKVGHLNSRPTATLLARLAKARIEMDSSVHSWSGELFQWCENMRQLFNDDYFHIDHVAAWLDLVYASEMVFQEIYSTTQASRIYMESFGDPVHFGAVKAGHLSAIKSVVILERRIQQGETGLYSWKNLPESARSFFPSYIMYPSTLSMERGKRFFPMGWSEHVTSIP